MNHQPNNPLHGKTLERILTDLQAHYGWRKLSLKTNFNGFKRNPTIKSCLKRLRQTPWARAEVEELWLRTFVDKGIKPPKPKKKPAPTAKPKQD